MKQPLNNEGDELGYLYYLLKDEPSVEKIALPLFNNLLVTWSQRSMFQPQEREKLITLARNEAEMLVLPRPSESVLVKSLALEYLTRYMCFSVFNNAEIRNELISHLEISQKNQRAVYDSLVNLIWQDRICKRYHDALLERIRLYPIAKHSFVLAAHAIETKFGVASSAGILASKKSFQFLFKEILKAVKFKMPLDEKEERINALLGEWIVKLKEMPFEKLCHEIFYTDTVVKMDFIDEWRGEHTQGRYPEGGYKYLDAEATTPDGRKISTLEILEDKYESLQIQPMDIHSPLTDSQKENLEEFLSKTEVKILEILYNYQDLTQKEVAEYVECTQSKVNKARCKFERFKGEIKKILEIQ